MKQCIKCNTEINDWAKYCRKCGEKQPIVAPVEEATEASDPTLQPNDNQSSTFEEPNYIQEIVYEAEDLKYVGEVRDGKPYGQGKIYSLSRGHLMQEGTFTGSTELNGEGKLYYESGALRYEGTFKDGKANGEGKKYYEKLWDAPQVAHPRVSPIAFLLFGWRFWGIVWDDILCP